jgi:hypothetical protein
MHRAFALLLAVFLGAMSAAPAPAALPPAPSGMPTIAEAFPLPQLRQTLIPRAAWQPYPVATNRAAWLALPAPLRAELTAQGEAALLTPLPPLPATLYLEYARVGNRSRFEKVFFQRRALLRALVMAECVEDKGRFLDAAANALWSICEESTWCLPAHINHQRAGTGLPDVQVPEVDLFAGESGVAVAWSLYLLGPQWDRVSPRLRVRAQQELVNRLLRPVHERDDFGWMALNVTRPESRPNNWTPWIASSLLAVALTSDPDPDRRAAVVHKMIRSLDGFLRFHPADGGCDEGPGYWSRAGASVLDCLELLHSGSDGRIDYFQQALVRDLGRFILNAHINDNYYVPIGDCAARMEVEPGVAFRFGQRVNDPQLLALASSRATWTNLVPVTQFFGRQLPAVFCAAPLMALRAAPEPLLRDVWLPSDDLQFMAARSLEGSTSNFYVAAWGAHNAQSHNHNDVGNVLVFCAGEPVFIDLGAPTYTAQTFSGRRYEILPFQSAWHNAPTINGVMQGAGRKFAARDVKYEANDTSARFRADLAGAYPANAAVKSWVRTVHLERGRYVELTEDYTLTEQSGATTLNFITPFKPDLAQPGEVRWSQPRVRLAYDPAKLTPAVEEFPLEDARLELSWGARVYRLVFTVKSTARQDQLRLRLTPLP